MTLLLKSCKVFWQRQEVVKILLLMKKYIYTFKLVNQLMSYKVQRKGECIPPFRFIIQHKNLYSTNYL